jgi:hypothetical protein
MAIKIGSNFTFQGEQPNFERDRFATKAAMKAFPETSIDDGHLSYCAEDGNTYQFKSSNSVDAVIGKWRVFKADVDLSAYATKDSVAADLDKKVDIHGKNVYAGDSNVKVATIPVPIRAWQTVTVTIDIRCRYSSYNVDIRIRAAGTNNFITVDAKKNSNNINKDTEKVYYYIDNSVENNYKVIIFYKNERFDTVYGRIVAMSGQYTVLPTLNMEVAAELPEGAVEIRDIGYGNKNLFYATPKDAAGDPEFRVIDITDIPDLSSKYGTRAEITTINNNITDLHSSLESTQTDFVDLRNKVNAMPKTVFITQAAYDALTTKDANTIYYING